MPPPSFKTADLMDAHPACRSCAAQFRSFGGRAAFAGPIRTVRCLDDNALIRRTLEQPSKGDVLVVDGGGSLKRALVGDNLAGIAAHNGWAGIVVNGAIRDVEAIKPIDLGLFALGTNPHRSDRTGAGQVDVPVSFGGVEFTPGAWLYADADGVIVSATALPV
ncbi:MAG TPA: ribonuclease E activity regulator RraA [Opitutaceae bacterium]